jgi:hypothetical protein
MAKIRRVKNFLKFGIKISKIRSDAFYFQVSLKIELMLRILLK